MLELDEEMRKHCNFNTGESIGKGSYGSIIKGLYNGKEVAIKFMCFDAGSLLTYQDIGVCEPQEIDILSRIEHPTILHSLDVVTPDECESLIDPDVLGIILPLAREDLHKRLRQNPPPIERLRAIYQILVGLNYLHKNNYAHLDIASDNVLVTKEGDFVLSDFGLASLMFDGRTVPAENVVIKYPYRPPEEFFWDTKQRTVKTDIWSLGVLICFILGIPTFINLPDVGEAMEAFDAILNATENTGLLNQQGAGVIKLMMANKQTLDDLIEQFIPTNTEEGTREQLKEIILSCLRFKRRERPTTDEILRYSVFDRFRHYPEEGSFFTYYYPPKRLELQEVERIPKLVEVVILMFPTNFPVTLPGVFLAIDLLYRCYQLLENDYFNYHLAHACLLLAERTVTGRSFLLLRDYVKVAGDMESFAGAPISNEILRIALSKIVYHLKGIIYRPYLYEHCEGIMQARDCIILALKDPQNYLAVQPQEFVSSKIKGEELDKTSFYHEYAQKVFEEVTRMKRRA
jgi:serine/threonine protein kinase